MFDWIVMRVKYQTKLNRFVGICCLDFPLKMFVGNGMLCEAIFLHTPNFL